MKKASRSIVKMLLSVTFCLLFAGQIAQADYVFGTPESLGPLMNVDSTGGCCIASDGLSLIFHSSRPPKQFPDYDLWMTTRPTKDDDWGPPERLSAPLSSLKMDLDPWLSADGLELYFSNGVMTNTDIVVSRRNSTTEPWSVPEKLGSMVNSTAWDGGPCLTADGLELYFSSNRSGAHDLYVSTRATVNDPWGPAMNLGPTVNSTEVHTYWGDQGPEISADGLTLLFHSIRAPGSASTAYLWMTRRKTRVSEWETPVLLELPGDNDDWHPCLYENKLFFTSMDRTGGDLFALWQVEVTPIVDFNRDRAVDLVDALMLTDNWETDNSLYDIAPSPFGDGVVDAKDLRTLTDYMIGTKQPPPLQSIDAKAITAAASSSDSANTGPERTIDGSGLNEHGQHSTVGTDMWLSGGSEPQWIQYEFDGVYQLNEMHVWNHNQVIEAFIGIGAKDVLIETSMDGTLWTKLEGATQFNQATGSAEYTANTIVDFGGIAAKFVRISILSGYGMWSQWGLSEVRFY